MLLTLPQPLGRLLCSFQPKNILNISRRIGNEMVHPLNRIWMEVKLSVRLGMYHDDVKEDEFTNGRHQIVH